MLQETFAMKLSYHFFIVWWNISSAFCSDAVTLFQVNQFQLDPEFHT